MYKSSVSGCAQYSCAAVKYDRRGYKPRARALLASDAALYVLDAASRKTFKLKHRLPLDKLRVVVTNENDELVLIKIPQDLKKDKVGRSYSPFNSPSPPLLSSHSSLPRLFFFFSLPSFYTITLSFLPLLHPTPFNLRYLFFKCRLLILSILILNLSIINISYNYDYESFLPSMNSNVFLLEYRVIL